MRKVRILIADDHQVVREGLMSTLKTRDDFEVVGQATNGEEAVQKAAELQPDVVIIDIKMPKLDGIRATAAITRQNPAVNVVVLSTFDEDETIYKSIQAGAKGYVLKGDNLNALIDVVHAAADGKSLLPPHIATKLIERISNPPQNFTLTTRELEILRLMADGMRNRDIGAKLHITERTVKNHVAKIISKMNVKSRTEAVSLAVKEKVITLG